MPNEQHVTIDKAKERRLRPSLLAENLKKNQERPPRFKPNPFLECLYEAFERLNTMHKGMRGVIKLLDIYKLITLLPGQSNEYTKAEFVRDIYLLDQSGVTKTKDGAIVSFPASTGTKSLTSTISVITKQGHEKIYYGISFDKQA
jgi:hypothetical protein